MHKRSSSNVFTIQILYLDICNFQIVSLTFLYKLINFSLYSSSMNIMKESSHCLNLCPNKNILIAILWDELWKNNTEIYNLGHYYNIWKPNVWHMKLIRSYEMVYICRYHTYDSCMTSISNRAILQVIPHKHITIYSKVAFNV